MVFEAYPEQQRDMRWVLVSLTTLATLLLIFRITATIRHRGWLGLEDFFVITANIFLILLATFIYGSTIYGFGLRVVDIKRTGGNVTKAMQFFWLTQTWYTITNGFNKMAFLALYYRVFPMKQFRRACIVLGAISAAWTVSFVCVCLFQCTPIKRVYDRTIPGTCISFAGHRWSNAISNLITDLTIFILPMPVIFKLNMSTGSRVGLVILFSLGFFICLTTALRMATLPLTLNTKQPTYESAPTNIWSFIEAAVGVICACLISLRKSIGALWPTRWRSNKGTNSGRYHTYGSARSGPRGLATPRGALVRNSKAFALEDMKTGGKIVTDTCLDVSPSESQERIIGEGKTSTRVTTDRLRSESLSESEDVGLQGITVTTDVKIERH